MVTIGVFMLLCLGMGILFGLVGGNFGVPGIILAVIASIWIPDLLNSLGIFYQ
jgi:hypothetical protein